MAGGESEILSISKDQTEYYAHYFNLLCDGKDRIDGKTASNLLRKSKLSQRILAIIWEHADIDKDGSLTVSEFFIAMHLTVLLSRNYSVTNSQIDTIIRSALLINDRNIEDCYHSPKESTPIRSDDNIDNSANSQTEKIESVPTRHILDEPSIPQTNDKISFENSLGALSPTSSAFCQHHPHHSDLRPHSYSGMNNIAVVIPYSGKDGGFPPYSKHGELIELTKDEMTRQFSKFYLFKKNEFK